MENKNKFLNNTAKFTQIVGLCIGVILIVFEVIICAEYANLEPMPAAWKIGSLVGCSVILDVLFFVEYFYVKHIKGRITVYCFDFVFLLFICAITGNSYLAGLYCVFLSMLYLNVVDMKTKIIVFVSSCILYIVTSVVGWVWMNMRTVTYGEIIQITAACVVGLITLAVHFAVANICFGFYRTNVRLKEALREADESKKQLEEAYGELEETAVFKERNRIARDIHDNAGHSMTAVIMQTEAAKLLIDSDPGEAKAKIIAANIQAKNALEQMRDSVHLLAGRNAACSLKEELEEIIAQTMDGTDIIVRYDICETGLAPDRRRFIANSLKECLSNGMRHGGAKAFYVELSENDGFVTLTVSDNGCGLPQDFKEGFGIRGIREKAAQFGGGIVFESESGDGCEINVKIKSVENQGEKE
ncbi:MAG: sensor histidine kinase [Clostridia bacterium]|nr:sensor histidine kinase [Clostridia bacterium]